jgi:hypothetical protein
MNFTFDSVLRRLPLRDVLVPGVAVLLACPVAVHAQAQKNNPASKVYITDVSGEAIIDTGEKIDDLTKRSVYTVQGSVIETKRPEKPSDKNRYFSTMVYSNGTGAFFDSDTRVEVKRFVQEPFTPNRNDVEVEPSISQTQAFLSRGAVGLCNSKLVAGSYMTYTTPAAAIKIRGRKLVLETTNDMTKVSMLEGESTIQAGPLDSGGHVVRSGEQAIIRRSAPGEPMKVEIRRIPSEEMPALDDKVAMACMARKSVYFEVRDKKTGGTGTDEAGSTAAGASADGTNSSVTAFDGGTATGGTNLNREIVPVEILPTKLPVEFTISNASIVSQPAR